MNSGDPTAKAIIEKLKQQNQNAKYRKENFAQVIINESEVKKP